MTVKGNTRKGMDQGFPKESPHHGSLDRMVLL